MGNNRIAFHGFLFALHQLRNNYVAHDAQHMLPYATLDAASIENGGLFHP
jgi:hypothetical protein